MFCNEEDLFTFPIYQQNLKKHNSTEISTVNSNKKSLLNNQLYFDNSFSLLTENISKYFTKVSSDINKSLLNPYCPLCLKYIDKAQNATYCNLPHGIYVIHDKCLLLNPSFSMSLINQQQDEMFLIKQKQNALNDLKNNDKRKNQINKLDNRMFIIQISFYHPISDKKFCRLQKKININNSDSNFIVQFVENNNQNEQQFKESLYQPNIIALPLSDYLINIKINQIGQTQNVYSIKKYLNFRKLQTQQNKEVIYFGNQQIKINLSTYKTIEEKNNLIQQLNYKYKYKSNQNQNNSQNDIIVKILKIVIQIPDQFKQQKQNDYYQIIQQSSSKMLQLLEIDKTQKDSQITKKTSKSNVTLQSKSMRFNNKYDFNQQQQDMSSSINSSQKDTKEKENFKEKSKQKVINLQHLISSGKLIQFVKNNNQSRSFQNFLNHVSNQQIDRIIEFLKNQFVQLIKHQYGNYMMQKLFSVCSLSKRLTILQILASDLSNIVMNKQGTHAFQDYLSFLTTQNQYILILQKIRQNFFQLCTHNNGTHFIQKVIKIFPLQLLNQFYYYCIHNLYQFSCDKNGMCVIKHMMKKLNQTLSNKNIIKQNQVLIKLVQQYQRLFAQATLFNLDALIGDMYGNYIVQFNFQLFEPMFILALTQSILLKVPQYSLSKYSTNVVFKCLNIYWANNKSYVSSILKQVFQPYLVFEMYKNKDGNKILLQIMQRYQGYEIWTKLHSILIVTEPTRYYHDRWGVCFGIRSGNVGGTWSNFTDAVEKLNGKRNNHKVMRH